MALDQPANRVPKVKFSDSIEQIETTLLAQCRAQYRVRGGGYLRQRRDTASTFAKYIDSRASIADIGYI